MDIPENKTRIVTDYLESTWAEFYRWALVELWVSFYFLEKITAFIESSSHKKPLSTSKSCFASWLHRYREDQLPVAISKQVPPRREVTDPGERGRDLTCRPAECLITPSSPACAFCLCFLPKVGPFYPLSQLIAPLATGYLLCSCCQLGWWATRPGGHRGSWEETEWRPQQGLLLLPPTIQLCLP